MQTYSAHSTNINALLTPGCREMSCELRNTRPTHSTRTNPEVTLKLCMKVSSTHSTSMARRGTMDVRGFRVPSLDDGVELGVVVVSPGPALGRRPTPGDALPVFVTVHPYGMMGGSKELMAGACARLAWRWNATGVFFDLRGVGESTGSCTITQQSEVQDVRAVCRWVRAMTRPGGSLAEVRCLRDASGAAQVVILGSSAGGPVAGSALDEDGIVAAAFTGYVFGWWASWLFGGHYSAVVASSQPKLFIQGESDGFTSTSLLESRAAECRPNAEVIIVKGVGHFELESPDYDEDVADMVADFVHRNLHLTPAGEPPRDTRGDAAPPAAAGDADDSPDDDE